MEDKKRPEVDIPPKPVISSKRSSKPEPIPKPLKPPVPVLNQVEPTQPGVYALGDAYEGERVIMSALGIDIGTKNVVMAYKKGDTIEFLQEVNGFYVFPNPSKFVENMLDDANKIRSDGTKRPAKWVKLVGQKGIYVLGKDAEELAYAHNDTLQRPMALGGIAQEEDSMMVLATIVQGLLDMAENEVGKFDKKVEICYCTTAPAINVSSNIDYHRRVIDLIIGGYESNAELNCSAIKESHAIVLKESTDATGIGISWGAGTVTVSYVLWGQEVYSFCWVGAGDWIDTEVAKRHGYDPDKHRAKSKETPTTVCRRKEEIDLAADSGVRLDIDLVLHYKILIANVIGGIVQGFVENENSARIDRPILVFMAGGTSSPNGFTELVKAAFDELDIPFGIAGVKRCDKPVLAVAEGCLMAAELQ